MGEWISVDDKMPMMGKPVLVVAESIRSIDRSSGCFIAWRNAYCNWRTMTLGRHVQGVDENLFTITHWVPLPSLPKHKSKPFNIILDEEIDEDTMVVTSGKYKITISNVGT